MHRSNDDPSNDDGVLIPRSASGRGGGASADQAADVWCFGRAPSTRRFTVSGKLGLALRLLVEKGSSGLSATEFSGPPYRLDSYISKLRLDCGLDIRTTLCRGRRPGRSRYVLVTPVQRLPTTPAASCAEGCGLPAETASRPSELLHRPAFDQGGLPTRTPARNAVTSHSNAGQSPDIGVQREQA